jgi:hypothetical protein
MFCGIFAAVAGAGCAAVFVPWRGAHAGLSQSRGRSAGRGLPHQPVADRRRHRRLDRARLHGRRAEALLPARAAHRLHLRQHRRGAWLHLGAIFILLLFVVLGIRGLRTVFLLRDPICAAAGLRHHDVTILIQAFFNMSVVRGAAAYQGHSAAVHLFTAELRSVIMLASIGILLNLTREID